METTNKMPVFANKQTANYSGGMCIVAARSAEEAHEVIAKYEDGWFCDDYKKDNWKQVPNVYCETDTPVFIDEDGYGE